MVSSAIWSAAIAVTIGVASGGYLVWATETETLHVMCGGAPTGPTPLGTAPIFVVGPTVQQMGSYRVYSFMFEAAGNQILENLDFQIQNPFGVNVTSSIPAGIEVFSPNGSDQAHYSLVTQEWTFGGSTGVVNLETGRMDATMSDLSGDYLVMTLASEVCVSGAEVGVGMP